MKTSKDHITAMSMSMKWIGSLSLIWLVLATVAAAQYPVLDSNGRPLQRGRQYYIKPAITDSGGRFTLINRNGSCPLYVGLENVTGPKGLPVVFTPFAKGESMVRVGMDFKVSFSASTICVQSTQWKVGERDSSTGRRVIVTGSEEGERPVQQASSYFRLDKSQAGGDIYQFAWCPTEVCPTCRFRCGTAGNLRENGKLLFALDGGVLPVVFERA